MQIGHRVRESVLDIKTIDCIYFHLLHIVRILDIYDLKVHFLFRKDLDLDFVTGIVYCPPCIRVLRWSRTSHSTIDQTCEGDW